MSAAIDVLDPKNPNRILIVASNPATSEQTGWPIGFWWSELVHPYWEFVGAGYEVTIASPDGGALAADSWSDPRDESGYSSEDLLSLGFINSASHLALTTDTPRIADIEAGSYAAVMLIGGQGPMYTFYENEEVHDLLVEFHDSSRIAAAICHGTCALLKARRPDGSLLVEGKTWTGFANSEEDFADEFVGQAIQPFRIEDEAKAIDGTNMIVAPRFKPHAIRDGNLITGQQQYSGASAARLIIEAIGA